MTVTVGREQVLAYRIAAQGLHRDTAARADRLAVLDLGVQDTSARSARLAFAARLRTDVDPLADRRYALAWTLRGAPHVHRAGDLRRLALALWPRDDADAAARIGGGTFLRGSGLAALDGLRAAAEAMHAAVPEPTEKGTVSGEVTTRIPEPLALWCRGCDCTHIQDSVLRASALPAGLQIVPGRNPLTLTPIKDWPGIPRGQDGMPAFAAAYLRLLGPARPSEVGSFFAAKPTAVRATWPDGLAEVRVGGTAAWLPEADLDALRTAERREIVRLLPPLDPYLQARDRTLLVPENAHQKALWRILGNPGGLLVDGEIAGIWRARNKGKTVAITVSPFGRLARRVRTAVEEEAQRVRTARDAEQVEVGYDA